MRSNEWFIRLCTVPQSPDFVLFHIELVGLLRIKFPITIPGDSHEDVDEFTNIGNNDSTAVEKTLITDESIGE